MELNLSTNSFYVAKVIVSGLRLFLLYRKVVTTLRALSIWSLVLSMTSFGRIADIGAAKGISRFVAPAKARRDVARELILLKQQLSQMLPFIPVSQSSSGDRRTSGVGYLKSRRTVAAYLEQSWANFSADLDAPLLLAGRWPLVVP